MSFELFLVRYEHGQPSSELIENIRTKFTHFGPHSEAGCWQLVYDEHNCCDVYVATESTANAATHNLMVSRPCGDIRLWNSLYLVLCSGPWGLFFPSDQPRLAVADLEHCRHFPPEMLESIGPATQVRSGEELARHVAGDELC